MKIEGRSVHFSPEERRSAEQLAAHRGCTQLESLREWATAHWQQERGLGQLSQDEFEAALEIGITPLRFRELKDAMSNTATDQAAGTQPKTSPYPFCVDCKHCHDRHELFESTRLTRVLAFVDILVCDCDLSLVTGERDYASCAVARGRNSLCGLEGRLFEAKAE